MRTTLFCISLLLTATAALAIPLDHEAFPEPSQSSNLGRLSSIPCVDGMAGDFQCRSVDLLAYLPLNQMGCGNRGNDIWGWSDPVTGTEYALMGCNNGTAFVDLSDPENPVHIGNLPSHTGTSTWRDIKVYEDHAYVVSEASGHGLQVFDLTQLRDVLAPPVVFSNTAHLGSFGQAHNVAINEDSGFAYVVGAGRGNPATCSGGLFMVNIQQPANPQFAGCFSADGYSHDTQCVIYQGPDENYQGNEICFNSNENTLTIVDVSDKANPVMLGRETYPGVGYAHQGWLTEDHHYFLLGDETDEINQGHNTRTRIWDVSDLNAPEIIGIHDSTENAIDHNLYTRSNFVYQSNYTAGLRILDLHEVGEGELTEVAYFDVFPDQRSLRHDGGIGFHGTWSNYPYFESGIVIVSTIGSAGEPGGLFVLQPHLVHSVIEGVVTRSDTGEPIAGALIEVSGETSRRTTTGPAGSYQLETLVGTYTVTASSAGFLPAEVTGIELSAGEPEIVNFTLDPAPMAAISPASLDFEVPQGASDSLSLEIGNIGDGDLLWSIETDPIGTIRSGHEPELDEVLALADFNLPGNGSHADSATAGIESRGQVIGFSFQGTVSGISGTGTWASDMRMTITSPDGLFFVVGGFNGTNPWDFDGSGSTDNGTYSSTHIGAGIFGEDGALDEGTWTFDFEHTWNDTMAWTDVTITLHKMAPPFCVEPGAVDWLSVDPASGSTGAGDIDEVAVNVDTTGLALGSHQAHLCLITNDPLASLTPIPVQLMVIEPPPGELAVDPVLLDFGAQVVGSESTGSFSVINAGVAGAQAIELTGITLTDGSPAFALGDGDCSVGMLLAGQDSCSVAVTFAPGESGVIDGAVSVEVDGGDTEIVTLSGSGIEAGVLEADPPDLAFGDVVVGAAQTAEVTVSNAAGPGGQILNVAAIELLAGSPGFQLSDGSCAPGIALPPQQSCVLEVLFEPGESGQFDGTLTVTTDEGPEATVTLTGMGIESGVLAIGPAELDFGEVWTDRSKTLTISIGNSAEGGAGDLLLTMVELVSGQPGFTLDEGGNCEIGSTILAPGQSCMIEVTLAPGEVGTFAGEISISTDDGVGGQSGLVELYGVGAVAPPLIFNDRFEQAAAPR